MENVVIIKIVKMEIAHCEVCPFVTGETILRCHYPDNVIEFLTLHKRSRPIYKSELPIPKWCKLENKDIKVTWK